MKTPTILLVSSGFVSASRGYANVCEDLAQRFEAAGYSVLTTSDRAGRVARAVDMLRTVWQRRHSFDLAQIDVFSGPAFLWAEAAAALLHQLHKPFILTLHGGQLPDFASRWTGRVSRLLAGAAAITTPSPYLREALGHLYKGIQVVPNPLDIDLYPYQHRAKPAPRLVWLRAFHPVYNPALAVRVMQVLQQQIPDIHLTMAGPDKGFGTQTEIRQLIATNGLTDRITIQGAVPKQHVPHWLNQGDIFLNTTFADNTPVSVIEAMACGLCVISTRVGGLSHIVSDGQNGLLVPPDDAAEMIAAITRVLSEPGLGARLSRQARSFAESLDWSSVLPVWQGLIEDASERMPT